LENTDTILAYLCTIAASFTVGGVEVRLIEGARVLPVFKTLEELKTIMGQDAGYIQLQVDKDFFKG